MISTNYNIFLMPSIVFILGGIIASFLKGKIRSCFSLLVPILSFYFLTTKINLLSNQTIDILGFNLVIFAYDKISLLFAYIFHIFAFIALIYAAFSKNSLEIGAGLFYVGASLGVIFAGDFFSFYLFWEALTLGAVIFIYLGKEKDSKDASFRYLIFHFIGGLILLSGILLLYRETGVNLIRNLKLGSLPSYLIFIGFGINAGFPLLNTWILDSYPKASIVGTVFLSSLTTKVGIYALIRCFLGTQSLIYIGIVMVILPVFYAVIENDLRKVLAYSLINQLGFMIVGIGIGTNLSINGTLSHVFVHIIYKSLLFMALGAVYFKYRTCKATKLGGLYKKMPLVTCCAIIASLSIMAFPMFSGFVTKSMIIESALTNNLILIYVLLIVGSAAVVKYFKVPYRAFFKENVEGEKLEPITTKRVPRSMNIAMSLSAILCIMIGLFPQYTIYKLLPFNLEYNPYTPFHVVTQLEILLFAAFSLCLCIKYKLYPKETDKITVNFDYFYRKSFTLFNNASKVVSEYVHNKSYNTLILLGKSLNSCFLNLTKKLTEKKIRVGVTLNLIVIMLLLLFFM